LLKKKEEEKMKIKMTKEFIKKTAQDGFACAFGWQCPD